VCVDVVHTERLLWSCQQFNSLHIVLIVHAVCTCKCAETISLTWKYTHGLTYDLQEVIQIAMGKQPMIEQQSAKKRFPLPYALMNSLADIRECPHGYSLLPT